MIMMWKSLLLLFLLLKVSWEASIPSTSAYNRYLIAHFANIVVSNMQGSPAFIDHYYSFTFASTIVPPDRVYLCTQNIDARIFDSAYPNNNSYINLEYYISLFSRSDTSLTVKVRGYFERPHFYNLDLRYLLVSNGNPFQSDYMFIQYINLKKGDKQQNIDIPQKYVNGHTLNFSVMLKDAKAQFTYEDLNNFSNRFFIQWNYRLYSNSITFQLVVPPYFQNGYYEIQYLVILIDYTMLNQDYPQYRFETVSYDTIGLHDQNIAIPYNLYTAYNNYLFGLSKVQFTLKLHSNFQFILLPQTSTNMSVIPTYLGQFDSYTNFTYGHTIFIYFDCPTAQYRFYNASDNRCYDSCSSTLGYYFNASDNTCIPCRFDCLTCKSTTQCLSCNTTYRLLINGSCLPLPGMYQSSVPIPYNCSSNCTACINSPQNCTVCAANRTTVLSNSTCLPCNTLFDGCSICTEFYCISCLNNYTLINATFCNLPCNDSNCSICSNLNTSVCITCKTPDLSLSNQFRCVGTCGDGKIIDEACDDGNLISHDGCDANCFVESDYVCYNKTSAQGFNYTQYCAYRRAIDFQVVSVEKLPHSNELSLLLSVSQYSESFWRTKSPLSYCFVETPVPYRNMRVQLQSASRNLQQSGQSKLSPVLASQYPSQSHFLVTFEYLSSMQGRNVSLSFDFRNSTDLALVEIPTNQVSLTIQPGNSHYAHYYSADTYERQKLLERLFTLLAVVALLMYAASLVLGGKRIAAEQVMVLQLTYLSLLSLPAFTPLHYSVTALRLSTNGVYVLYDSSLPPFNDVLSDSTAKGAQLYSQFLYNFNTGILVIIVPLLVALGAFLASKIGRLDEAGTKRVQRVYRLAVGEYTFTGLIFAGSIIGAAALLEVRFGCKEISSTIGLASLYVPVALLVLFPLYLTMRLCLPAYFEEYGGVMREGSLPAAFQLFYCSLGLLLGAALAGLASFQWTGCAVAALCLALFFFITFRPLFRKQFDHYRTQLNLLTLAFTQIPFIYARLSPTFENSSENDLAVLLPLLLVILLCLCLFGNLVFFVYQAVKRIREGLTIQQTAKGQEAAKGNFENLYKSSLINPFQYTKKPRFIDSFIEHSDQDDEQKRQMVLKGLNWKAGSVVHQVSEPTKTIILQKDYINTKFNEINQL